MSWVNVLLAPMAVLVAFGKGRSMIFWGTLTIFAGWWSFIPLLFIPRREVRIPATMQKFVTTYFIKREMRGIQSPADL